MLRSLADVAGADALSALAVWRWSPADTAKRRDHPVFSAVFRVFVHVEFDLHLLLRCGIRSSYIWPRFAARPVCGSPRILNREQSPPNSIRPCIYAQPSSIIAAFPCSPVERTSPVSGNL
jgi:hypothetical protein